MSTEFVGFDKIEIEDQYFLLPGANKAAGNVDTVVEGKGRSAFSNRFSAIAASANSVGMTVSKSIQVTFTDDGVEEVAPGESRSAKELVAADGKPAFGIEVPISGPYQHAVILYIDDAGVCRFIRPSSVNLPNTTTRGSAGVATFHLPRQSGPIPKDGKSDRSIAESLRSIHVLKWITDPAIGLVIRPMIRKWEAKNRPYGICEFPFGKSPVAIDPENSETKAKLRKKRCLLFIHGTFSTSAGGFGDFDDATVDALKKAYEGSIIGFNHPSLGALPSENAEFLLNELAELWPSNLSEVEFDIVTHSRGGLVARALAAKNLLKIRRTIIVASPNMGTSLADGDHGVEFMERYTTIASLLPSSTFKVILEGVLLAIKAIYHAATHELPGLNCMDPKGDYLNEMNAGVPSPIQYFGIASNFSPAPGSSLAIKFGDFVVDAIFDKAGNDLVVPSDGAFQYQKDDWHWIPTASRLSFDKAGNDVHHLNYFEQKEVRELLVKWLTAP